MPAGNADRRHASVSRPRRQPLVSARCAMRSHPCAFAHGPEDWTASPPPPLNSGGIAGSMDVILEFAHTQLLRSERERDFA